jgi:hypothetical protein
MTHPLHLHTLMLDGQVIIFLSILVTIMLIISNPSKVNANPSGVGFYSPSSPPAGVKSLEPLMAKWWTWWNAVPAATATNWPGCIRGDGGKIGNNQSVVFIGNGAFAVDKNVNARNQKCEISSNQLLYLTIYPGECSTGVKPHEGEFPDTKSPADLLTCAHNQNQGIKLMQAKVDGSDVSSNITRQTTSQTFNFIVPQDNAFAFPTPIAGGNNYSMAEDYYLFFKPLPVGDHTIDFHVIRAAPAQAVENDVAHWDIKVVP